MKPLTDSEAVDLFNRGDERGFEYLYKQLHPVLLLYAKRFTKCHFIAEEAINDIFMKVFTRQNHKFEAMNDLRAFLFKATFYETVQGTKIKKRAIQVDPNKNAYDYEIHDSETIESAIIRSEVYREIFTCLNELSPECRSVNVLLFWYHKSLDEVSALMKTTKSTVKNHRARGLHLIKKRLPHIFTISPISTI